MLNPKKSFLKVENKKKIKILHVFGEDAFFDRVDTPSIFRNFRSEGKIW